MQPSQNNNKNGEISNSNEERMQKIGSEIKLKKQQLVAELDNSSADGSHQHRPKFPLSKTEKLGSQRKPLEFSPFLANTLKIPGNRGFSYGTNLYVEKYNMIIICPLDMIVHFYDATTLLPLEEKKALQIENSVLNISFCEATDICLFACGFGNIYAYDLSSHILTKLQEINGQSMVLTIAFVSPSCYAFSVRTSKQIFIGNLAEGSLLSFDSNQFDPFSIFKSEKENLLFSGLTNGSVIVYRTDRLPKLPVFCSERSQRSCVMKIENVIINGKEYIITLENGGFIRLCHFIKGKMRLVKVIPTGEKTCWWVYLEKYNMIITTHGKKDVRFWSLPSGKLKYTYSSKLPDVMNVFLMKDKDVIGIAGYKRGVIEIVKLSGVAQSSDK